MVDRVEQQQEAIRLVDLAAAVDREQRSRAPIVFRPQRGHRGVPELLQQLRAVDDVREEQGVSRPHRRSLIAEAF